MSASALQLFLEVIVVLLLIRTYPINGYIGCPPDDIKLITKDDIQNSSVQNGSVPFMNVLSTSANSDPKHRYFYANAVPNKGNITFNKNFLLIGLTTYGYRLSPSKSDQYVLNFTFEYSDSMNGQYIAYPMHGIVDNANEAAFFVDSPFPARRIQLTINEADTGGSTFYYWRINLFGCPYTDSVTYTTLPVPPGAAMSTPMAHLTLTPPKAPPTCTMPSSTPSITFNPLATSFITCVNSAERSLGVDDDGIATRTVTQNITVTVTETSTSGQSVSSLVAESDYCVPVIVVLSVVLVGVSVAWIVVLGVVIVYCRRGKSTNSNSSKRRDRRGTLNEVKNETLYTSSSPRSSSNTEDTYEGNHGSILIHNQLYEGRGDSNDIGQLVKNEAYELRNRQSHNDADNDQYETPPTTDGAQYESLMTSTNSSTQLIQAPPHTAIQTAGDNKRSETVYEYVD